MREQRFSKAVAAASVFRHRRHSGTELSVDRLSFNGARSPNKGGAVM